MAKTAGVFSNSRVFLGLISFLILFFPQRVLGANIASSIKRGETQPVQPVPASQKGIRIQLHKQVTGEPAVFVPEEFQHLAARLLGLHKKALGDLTKVTKFYDVPGNISKEKQEALWLLYALNLPQKPSLNECSLDGYEVLYKTACDLWLEDGDFKEHKKFVRNLKVALVERYASEFCPDTQFDIEGLRKRLSSEKLGWNKVFINDDCGEEGQKQSEQFYLLLQVAIHLRVKIGCEKVEMLLERCEKEFCDEQAKIFELMKSPKKSTSLKTPSTTKCRIERWEKIRADKVKGTQTRGVLEKPLVRAALFVAWTAACLAVGLQGKELYRQYKAGTLFTKAAVAQPSWFARLLAWFWHR